MCVYVRHHQKKPLIFLSLSFDYIIAVSTSRVCFFLLYCSRTVYRKSHCEHTFAIDLNQSKHSTLRLISFYDAHPQQRPPTVIIIRNTYLVAVESPCMHEDVGTNTPSSEAPLHLHSKRARQTSCKAESRWSKPHAEIQPQSCPGCTCTFTFTAEIEKDGGGGLQQR